ERQQIALTLLHAVERFALGLSQRPMDAHLDELDIAADCVQRSPQLMTHDRQKLTLRPHRVFCRRAGGLLASQRFAQLLLQILAASDLRLEHLRLLLQTADLAQSRVVIRLRVVLGRDHVFVLVTDIGESGTMSLLREITHGVRAEKCKALRAPQFVPQCFELHGTIDVAVLPEQVYHLAVGAHDRVRRRAPGGLDGGAYRGVEPIAVRPRSHHKRLEGLACIEPQTRLAARRPREEPPRMQTLGNRHAMRFGCYDDSGLARSYAVGEEVGDGGAEELVVLVKLNNVAGCDGHMIGGMTASGNTGWRRKS